MGIIEMSNLETVKETLKKACSPDGHEVLLIAVSKMQSIDSIKEAYRLGQRDFGENYIQELTEKAAELKESCPGIRWHFIGALQSNKISQLIKNVSGLKAIETVDSMSKFDKIWRALNSEQQQQQEGDKIELFLQVNISGEENKHGLRDKEEIKEIYRYYCELIQAVPNSRCTLEGLMMIGEIEESQRDFSEMIRLREDLREECGWIGCKLSMGMSGDYELAASMGSDIVRVGSAIFGARNYQK